MLTTISIGISRDMAAPEPPPDIHIQPPSTTIPPSYPIPIATTTPSHVYPPPDDRLPDPASSPRHSQTSPPPSSPRKSVQFSEKPEVSTFSDPVPIDSEAVSPERHHHRHHHSHSRGYEAEDDTDSTPDDSRRRTQEQSTRSRDIEEATNGNEKRRHRRRRSHDPGSSHREPSSRDRSIERVTSPADSEATVDIPARFDEKGRKKSEPGDDPLADKFEDMLSGKGAAGKVLGNFFDGLFGPDGRNKKGR
jgi:hypothetical protein